MCLNIGFKKLKTEYAVFFNTRVRHIVKKSEFQYGNPIMGYLYY